MSITNRKKGDFILDLRINQVGDGGKEKMVYIGSKKLAIREKIPSGQVETTFEALKSRFNEIIGNTNKEENLGKNPEISDPDWDIIEEAYHG